MVLVTQLPRWCRAACCPGNSKLIVCVGPLLSSEPHAPLPVSGKLRAVAQLTFCARPYCRRLAWRLTCSEPSVGVGLSLHVELHGGGELSAPLTVDGELLDCAWLIVSARLAIGAWLAIGAQRLRRRQVALCQDGSGRPSASRHPTAAQTVTRCQASRPSA